VALHAQRLAQKLDVPEFYTDIYQRIPGRLNISWLSTGALKAILEGRNFVRAVSNLGTIVHLPNQHETLEIYEEVEENLGARWFE
jgi:hypothetical protein